MSLATIERRLDDVWAWNSSTRLPLAEEPDNWLATFGEYCDFEPAAFAAHYVTHKNMMQQSASEDEQTFHALCYVRLRSY
ncbi:MAG: hypothetical protein U1D69_14975, partial [Polynucleobacter sp.]|nr:hypothetical protein [Polynucleobacter sp.]